VPPTPEHRCSVSKSQASNRRTRTLLWSSAPSLFGSTNCPRSKAEDSLQANRSVLDVEFDLLPIRFHADQYAVRDQERNSLLRVELRRVIHIEEIVDKECHELQHSGDPCLAFRRLIPEAVARNERAEC
jgi:hypothetical protein